MFHVKHDLKHDLAFEASDAFEYAPADAHDIRRARPEEQSEPGVDLATGRPVLATAGGRRVRGAARAARHFATGQTMPEAVRLYPTAWVPIARRSHDGGSQQPVPTSGAWSRLAMGGVGRGHGRPRGRRVVGSVESEIKSQKLPDEESADASGQSVSCPVSRETAEGDVRQHGDGHQRTTRLDELVAQNLGGDGGCLSLNAVPHAVLGVASLDRRILWDP